MAVLIPAIGSCRFETTGERRLAERLEQKLDDDYLLWFNVSMGPKQTYPDFDSAQSICGKTRGLKFSFKSLGIQAQDRTTILKINYRNTRQILELAPKLAGDLLTPDDRDEDGAPLLQPISCGRDGPPPLVIRLPRWADEPPKIAELLVHSHQEGHAWGDMAVLCRRHEQMHNCARESKRANVPHAVRTRSGEFDPRADTVKVMTMHASKGLEFRVVALPGVGQMAAEGEDLQEEARVFNVAATRATQRFMVRASGEGRFARVVG